MKLTLLNTNTTLSVVQFKSTEIAFNTDFTADIYAVTPSTLGDLTNTIAALTTDEGVELLRGVVTVVDFYVSHLRGYCYHFMLQSLLFPFSLEWHTRVHRNMTAEDILRKVLVSSGFQLAFDISNPLPVIPQVFQYKETDLAFVERFMAYYGLLGKFEPNGKTCIYRITDRLSAFDVGACPNFPYAPNSKQHEAPVMLAYHEQYELQQDHFVFTEFDANNPLQSFSLETTPNDLVAGQGERRVHGLGRFEPEVRSQLAQNWQAALDAARTKLTITIDDPTMNLGNTLTVSGNKAGAMPGKNYRIIEQIHYYRNNAYFLNKLELDFPEGYRQVCRLHPVSEPYYKMPIESALPAGILTASVQTPGDDTNPYDELGRYNVKFDLDELEASSILVHAMQPSTGATGGFHFPYRANTNVLVQCLGKDALDPVILGAMHLDDQVSLVTSSNSGQHLMTSKASQTLLLDDDSTIFKINDLASNLSMDASDAPGINLSTGGVMNLSANTGILEKVTSNSNYNIAQTHFQTVQDSVTKVSHNHQESSGQDMVKKFNGMELRAEGNTSFAAGQDFVMSVQSASLDNNNLLFLSEQGVMNLNSSSGLKLSAGKGFNIAQSGGIFSMDDNGNTQVTGKNNITLNFSDASLQGQKVNLGGSAGAAAALPAKPSIVPPKLNVNTVSLIAKQSKVMLAQTPVTLPPSGNTQHPLTSPQTNSCLEVHFDDAAISLPQSLSDWELSSNNEYRLYLKQAQPAQKMDMMPDKQLVLLHAVNGLPGLPAGQYDVDSISTEQASGLQDLVHSLIVNGFPVVGDTIKLVATQDSRAFLKDFLQGGSFVVKETSGKIYVIFRGSAKLRDMIKGTRYRYDNPQLKVIKTQVLLRSGDTELVMDGIKDAAADTKVGIIIVATVELIQTLSGKEGSKDLIDSTVGLLSDIAKLVIATVAAQLLVAAVATIIAGLDSVVFILGAVLILSFTFGILLDMADDKLHITQDLNNASHEAINYADTEFSKTKEWLNNETN